MDMYEIQITDFGVVMKCAGGKVILDLGTWQKGLYLLKIGDKL